jgi:hypothetical protein
VLRLLWGRELTSTSPHVPTTFRWVWSPDQISVTISYLKGVSDVHVQCHPNGYVQDLSPANIMMRVSYTDPILRHLGYGKQII